MNKQELRNINKKIEDYNKSFDECDECECVECDEHPYPVEFKPGFFDNTAKLEGLAIDNDYALRDNGDFLIRVLNLDYLTNAAWNDAQNKLYTIIKNLKDN